MVNKLSNLQRSNPTSTARPTPFPAFAGQVVKRPAGFRPDVGANPKLDDYTVGAYQYATSTRPDLCQPAAIVYAANESDVKLAVKYAYDANLSIAVRSSGHHFGGFSSGRGESLQLDVRALGNISELHPQDETVTFGTGCSLKELDDKFASMGAFVPHGECYKVAVGGHVQTGGASMFMRSFGYFCDYVTRFTIVLSPRHDDEDPSTVVVTKPTPGETTVENDELWFAVIGGSPGNFGVILDVTIKPRWDRDHPHSRGLALFRTFQGEKGRRDLEEWLQILAEFNDDDDMPADYNYSVMMLAGNPPGPLDLNNNIDVKMATEHPEVYGERAPGCPCVIAFVLTWTNLRGEACRFEDFDGEYCAEEIFARVESRTRALDTRAEHALETIKSSAGKVVFRKALELTGFTRWDGSPAPMSQLVIGTTFGARVQANPYVSAARLATSMRLSQNGFARESARLASDAWDIRGGWPDIQWGGYSGKQSRARPEHAGNPSSTSFRTATVLALYYVHYDNVIRRRNTDEPRRLSLENCDEAAAKMAGEGGLFDCDHRMFAFPNQDEDLDAVHAHYYDSELVYLRVLKAKRTWDPRDVFTSNLFCVGASRKYGTALEGSPALMGIQALEAQIASHESRPVRPGSADHPRSS